MTLLRTIRALLRCGELIASVSCAALAIGCGSGGPSPSRPATPVGANAATGAATIASSPGGIGSLIITQPDGLAEYNIKTGASKQLIKAADASTFVLDPAVSADNKLLAYVVQPPPKIQGTKYDSGSDLWVADRDGGGQHPVFTHESPNQLVRFPQWEDSDRLLAVVQEISDAGGTTSVTYALERIDVATGQRTRLLDDVLAFGLSPDAKHAVYAKLAPQTGETLETVDLPAGAPRTLVGIDQNLSPFNSPRYSPDGTRIAFASADQTGARADFRYVAAAFGPLPAPPADGLPEDIWTIDASGGTPRRVADLKEDLPTLAWGGDGKHLYVVGAAGLYDVNLTNGASTRLGDGSFHAQVVWTP